MVDSLIYLQCLLEITYSPLAGSHHELPFHFIRLDLAGSLEVEAGFLIEALLDVVDSQPDIGI